MKTSEIKFKIPWKYAILRENKDARICFLSIQKNSDEIEYVVYNYSLNGECCWGYYTTSFDKAYINFKNRSES